MTKYKKISGSIEDTDNDGAKDLSIVEEAAAIYKVKLSASKRLHAINRGVIINLHKPESSMTPFEKMDMIREGISKKDLETLKDRASLDYDNLARALSVTRATLINKKGDEKFNAALSERIVGLADIYSYGYQVFEDETSFNDWMFRPNQALGGQPPYNLIDNQFGREEIKNLIGRIEYGVYS